MAEAKKKIVDLYAKDPTTQQLDNLIPYNEIELTGGLEGSGHTRSNGVIVVEGNPTGFDHDWTFATSQGGKVLNIFRSLANKE